MGSWVEPVLGMLCGEARWVSARQPRIRVSRRLMESCGVRV